MQSRVGFVLLTVLLSIQNKKGSSVVVSECEKRSHVGFSPAQKKKICEGVQHVGPSSCAAFAKVVRDTLYL